MIRDLCRRRWCWAAGLLVCGLLGGAASLTAATADDWPEVNGPGRQNTWRETGILRQFPAAGLTVRWRTPLGPGYSGPAVAGGRVFVTDYQQRNPGGAERVICLEEQTGRVVWVYENPEAAYGKFAYNSGPRATPTVEGGLVFVMGAAGDLYCLGAEAGDLKWRVNLPRQFGGRIPTWGFSGAPVVYGSLVVTPAGGPEQARVVGLHKLTGERVWQALATPSDIGYSSPVLVRGGGVDQLIFWSPEEITSLNPATGTVYWRHPFAALTPCATPTVAGDLLLVSNFYKGSCLLRLSPREPAAELVWCRGGENEYQTQGLHALMCSPVFRDEYLYGVCSYGQFRCLSAATGERVWESLEPVREKQRWANAFVVRNGDVFFINNDRGELIIADLTAAGYRELSRTRLIAPTSGGAGGRELGKVNWVLPAYANRHVVTRNDVEIIRASLEQPGG